MELERGVRGDGMDHTKRFPRTLAGFGLTGHGGSRFSCFLEILATHFITKYLQIGPRASRLFLGFFWSQGTISGAIKQIDFPKNHSRKTKSGNLDNLQKSLFAWDPVGGDVNGAPTKRHKKVCHFNHKWRLWEVVQFPGSYFLLGSFLENEFIW